MHRFRFNLKRLSAWILLFFLILTSSFLYVQIDSRNAKLTTHRVTFVNFVANETKPVKLTYHTRHNKVSLRNIHTRSSYMDFNTSLCFINGTDVKSMQRSNNVNWKCTCLPGWHGNDCGQPEVIWRALLAYRKPVSIRGPRKYQRRIIYLLEVNEYSEVLTDIKVNEINGGVDLFVLYEIKSNYLRNRLNNRFLKEHHHKILYININVFTELWPIIKDVITNMEEDDIILTSNLHEIPVGVGITFFKFYNDWPEPINFRLKYTVYGFFWIHPSKTILSGSVCTVRYLYETLNDDLSNLNGNKTLMNLSGKNFIIGDLNHFGGWYCEFCNDPAIIIEYLTRKSSNYPIVWEKIDKIDNAYVENLIENGVYMDGKTELIRAHRFHENYFAPVYVSDNGWKFDFLTTNMFSKMDYYE